MKRILALAEIALIVVIALIPLFPNLPYRLNSYLSWEGAYRMANGQVPFKDFGMPLGYMYWVIPAVFFKIFGAQMITLIKAQVFINIISGLAFRSILKSFNVPAAISFVSVMVFCLTFSLPNYWPWYNNTVIFYELIALAFLCWFLRRPTPASAHISPNYNIRTAEATPPLERIGGYTSQTADPLQSGKSEHISQTANPLKRRGWRCR